MPEHAKEETPAVRSLRIQNAILTLAVFLLVGFQTFELIRAWGNLRASHAGQEQLFQQSMQMRRQLDAVANGAMRLSAEGNVNAKTVIENMQRQGVRFNTPPAQ